MRFINGYVVYGYAFTFSKHIIIIQSFLIYWKLNIGFVFESQYWRSLFKGIDIYQFLMLNVALQFPIRRNRSTLILSNSSNYNKGSKSHWMTLIYLDVTSYHHFLFVFSDNHRYGAIIFIQEEHIQECIRLKWISFNSY